jgi:hypothetical protein
MERAVMRFSTIAGAAALAASMCWAQVNPAGHWEGVFKAEGREITLGFDLAKNAKSEWIASMSMPDGGATGLVVMDLVVNGNLVRFVGVEVGMSKFDLTLEAGGKMAGTISNPQSTLPIEFRRTGEARVELIPPSPAVSKELEGDWDGTLQTPGRGFRIIVHFRNRADDTVAATIDTPDTGGLGLPLNAVKVAGRKVEFGIRIAHAAFQGTLSADGSELAGQFTHDETGVPLTLRKK